MPLPGADATTTAVTVTSRPYTAIDTVLDTVLEVDAFPTTTEYGVAVALAI
jgi:hypothetical protein